MDDRIPVIYLLGISFSGSTLLGYLLGASDRVFYAGELKQLNRIGDLHQRTCGCGCAVSDCPFWHDFDFQECRVFNKPTLAQKFDGAARILLSPEKVGSPWGGETDDVAFLRRVHQRMQEQQPYATYILDVSKSIYRLLHLLQYDELDVRIVHIERDIRGNVASFIKYGHGFLNGLLTYKCNQLLIRRLQHQLRRPYLHVHHTDLCRHPEVQFKRLGEFLDIDYSDAIERLRGRTYHVFTGNVHTHRQFQASFEGLRMDESWRQRLSPLQKRILDWLDQPVPPVEQ